MTPQTWLCLSCGRVVSDGLDWWDWRQCITCHVPMVLSEHYADCGDYQLRVELS